MSENLSDMKASNKKSENLAREVDQPNIHTERTTQAADDDGAMEGIDIGEAASDRRGAGAPADSPDQQPEEGNSESLRGTRKKGKAVVEIPDSDSDSYESYSETDSDDSLESGEGLLEQEPTGAPVLLPTSPPRQSIPSSPPPSYSPPPPPSTPRLRPSAPCFPPGISQGCFGDPWRRVFRINGRRVRMYEAPFTRGEAILGHQRAHWGYRSKWRTPLRKCWVPTDGIDADEETTLIEVIHYGAGVNETN